jgi:integrase
MNYSNLQELLDLLKDIPDSGKRDRILQLSLNTAADSINENILKDLIGEQTQKQTENEKVFLKFTKQELSKIPMRFRKNLILNDRLVRCRRRKSGKSTTNYEIRYRRNGYNICVSSNDLEKAKEKFIAALKCADTAAVKHTVPTTFNEFAMYYFENFRKRKVKEETFKCDMGRYKNHIKNYFGSIPIKQITASQCQKLLDGYTEKGMGKTADEIHSLLNSIFKMAIAHNLITQNPLAIVIHTDHERNHGKALTKQEEQTLLNGLRGTRYLIPFAVALYTGLRPNEYKTAKIKEDFIIAVNSKRKNGKIEYKRIGISPMLKPYLNGISELDFPYIESMRTHMNKYIQGHKIYDLRTTFYTRCRECGVADAARDEFMGHSAGALVNTYTDLSDEYLLKEISKLNY